MTSPRINPDALKIVGGYLVELTDECTCGGTDIGVGYQHESGCGMEPLMTVAELAVLLTRTGQGDPTEYRVGDPDPTPAVDEHCGVTYRNMVCTWSPGHGGQHVAGDGEQIVAVWSDGEL